MQESMTRCCVGGGSASCSTSASLVDVDVEASGDLVDRLASHVWAILVLAIGAKMPGHGVSERTGCTASCDADVVAIDVDDVGNGRPGCVASAVAHSGSGRIRVVASKFFGCESGEVPPQQNLLRLTGNPEPDPPGRRRAGPAWLGTGSSVTHFVGQEPLTAAMCTGAAGAAAFLGPAR